MLKAGCSSNKCCMEEDISSSLDFFSGLEVVVIMENRGRSYFSFRGKVSGSPKDK